MRSRGFSLIETLLYLALLSMLMTGGIAGAYASAESAERNREQARIEQDGSFLLKRLRWSLQEEAVIPELTEISMYSIEDLSIVRSGMASDLEDPEHVRVLFTLVAFLKSGPVRRTFQDTVYLNAP